MRALTVRQPWAWAIIHGGKNIENRTWRAESAIGQRIAIHAAKSIDTSAWNRVLVERRDREGPDSDLPRGVIIGTVEVRSIGRYVDNPWADGYLRMYHWRLARPRPLTEPVPATGRLGLWTLPAEIEALVAERGQE